MERKDFIEPIVRDEDGNRIHPVSGEFLPELPKDHLPVDEDGKVVEDQMR